MATKKITAANATIVYQGICSKCGADVGEPCVEVDGDLEGHRVHVDRFRQYVFGKPRKKK